jgi:hypothetical protein
VGLHPYWPALILSGIPAGCLLWGVFTGQMPQRYGTFDRLSMPAGYWTMAVIWGGLCAILLWIGLRL